MKTDHCRNAELVAGRSLVGGLSLHHPVLCTWWVCIDKRKVRCISGEKASKKKNNNNNNDRLEPYKITSTLGDLRLFAGRNLPLQPSDDNQRNCDIRLSCHNHHNHHQHRVRLNEVPVHLSGRAVRGDPHVTLAKISPSKVDDMTETQPQKKRRVSLCVGCGSQIHDQYILRVAPDLEWHAACLKCADCHQFLDETCTCFVRDGKTYCKRDYVRLFGAKCAKCNLGFSKNDFVMRARNKIYHIDCFRCMACSRQLIPGDEFALRDDGLFCKADHEVLEKTSPTSGGGSGGSGSGGGSGGAGGAGGVAGVGGSASDVDGATVNGTKGTGVGANGNGQNGHHPGQNGLQLAANAEPMATNRQRDSVRPQVHKNPEQKTTRVRTVLNEKQLHTLRTCYAANPRPDALMKEQLVEMTGLSPRVIRVWFQNKRCKDKKKSILMKQIQQQEKVGRLYPYLALTTAQDGRRLPGLAGMHGVPMIASSPVRHESPLQVNPVEVQSYQPPWKALSEFAMQSDLDRLDAGAPPFQQLMHGFTDPEGLVTVSGQQLNYLTSEDSLQQPPSNLSSHIAGTPSELSSPGSD